MIRRALLITLIACLMSAPAFATGTTDEHRARDIGAQLRCVVCQNQSIEESDAQLAQDMRRVVREQLASGASDADVIEYMRGNYGDYILLKPPVQPNTYVLWFLPFGLVLLGLIWFFTRMRQTQFSTITDASQDMSEDDKALLDDLMRDET